MPIDKKTAILVIHGVGPHMPFEVLDSFVHGFHEEFKEEHPSSTIKLSQELSARQNWLGKGTGWVQNYIRLSEGENGKGYIDFYEYFWDIYMIHDVKLVEALKLLIKASQNAKQFYKDRYKLLKEKKASQKTGQFSKEQNKSPEEELDLGDYSMRRFLFLSKKEFRHAGYLNLLGFWFRIFTAILPYIPFLIKFVEWWADTQIPIVSQISKLLNIFTVIIEKMAQNFIGDLVRYLDLDPRSAHFEIRQNVINNALDELRALLNSKENYDQIIIAGHSLGSVIAYDALNRLIRDMNAKPIEAQKAEEAKKAKEKIIGLVTFGSPLDKIALFIREQAGKGKYIQRQILDNEYSFHAYEDADTRSLGYIKKPSIDIGNPMKSKLLNVRWVNFYHKKDLISGKLDLYDLKKPKLNRLEATDDDYCKIEDGNILIKKKIRGFGKLGKAHACYWGEQQIDDKGKNKDKDEKKDEKPNLMYELIIKEFFTQKSTSN